MQPLANPSFVPEQAVRAPAVRVTAQAPFGLLDGDRIGFDAWLLAPLELETSERLVHLVSQVAGPLVLVATIAAGLAVFF